MAIAIKDDIDYEVNLKFIDDVRNELVDASHISSRSEPSEPPLQALFSFQPFKL